MLGGIGSPNFGPVGCWGAVLLTLFIVAVVVGLIVLAWSSVLFP